jgi:hypothetical protein
VFILFANVQAITLGGKLISRSEWNGLTDWTEMSTMVFQGLKQNINDVAERK